MNACFHISNRPIESGRPWVSIGLWKAVFFEPLFSYTVFNNSNQNLKSPLSTGMMAATMEMACDTMV